MKGVFFIVGPTATGKSDIAAHVARQCGGEIVSADAFQIYRGLDLLTAKPDQHLLETVPHHLIGALPLAEEMSAEKFRTLARRAIEEIHARGKPAFVVGGSGLYIKALTHGLSPLPPADPELRERLKLQPLDELVRQLEELDPAGAAIVDRKNRQRVIRVLEICLLTGRPASAQRQRTTPADEAAGVLLLRDRAELYERINSRVESMFQCGVAEEVRAAEAIGATAAKTLGLREIQALIAGEISEPDCIAAIQQATRRYAKRQLTWFQHQTTFEPLNLSSHSVAEAIEWIAQKARLSFSKRDD